MLKLSKHEAAALAAKASKTGRWSKEHKRIGRVLNRASDAADVLRKAGLMTAPEYERVAGRICKAGFAVGFSFTAMGTGDKRRTRVFIPHVRRTGA